MQVIVNVLGDSSMGPVPGRRQAHALGLGGLALRKNL
jgi:hypothetical protein